MTDNTSITHVTGVGTSEAQYKAAAHHSVSLGPVMCVAASDATDVQKAAAKASGGAICGVSNADVELQTAVNTIAAAGGGTLRLLGNTFNIDTSIVPNSSVIWKGDVSYHDDEQTASQLVGGSSVGNIIDLPNTDHHYTFRNISFVMPANTIGIKCEKGNFPSVRLHECAFRGTSTTGSYGVWLKTTYNSQLFDCRFQSMLNGVYLHSINNFYMHGGRVTSNTIGINNVNNGDSNRFDMVDMSSNGTGMYLEGGTGNHIDTCWFENNTSYGLWVYGSLSRTTFESSTFGSNGTDLYGGNNGAGAFHYDNTFKKCWFQGNISTDMWGRLQLEDNKYDGTVDWGANTTIVALSSDGVPVSAAAGASDYYIPMVIKGVTYKLLLHS